MSEPVGMYHPGVVGGALKKGMQQAQQQSVSRLSQLDGPLRSAIVLLSLGPEQAAELVKTFSPAEAQRVSSLVAAVRSLHRDMLIEVLEDFKNTTEHTRQVGFDPEQFIQTLASKFASQGSDLGLPSNLAQSLPALEMLMALDPEVLHAQLRNEHPQVVTTLLAMMPAEVSASLLEQFDEDQREELLMRLAVLDRVDPSALVELNEMLKSHLHDSSSAALSNMGGAKPVAEILSMFSDRAGQPVLEKIREHDAKLADQIVKRLFGFEDFTKISPQALQRLLSEVPSDVLVVALKGAGPALKEVFFANMTKRVVDRVKFEMDSLPPVRVQEVESKQREIIQIARNLQERNLISLDRTGRDAML
jgi:flagellar motor switch protein FliG